MLAISVIGVCSLQLRLYSRNLPTPLPRGPLVLPTATTTTTAAPRYSRRHCPEFDDNDRAVHIIRPGTPCAASKDFACDVPCVWPADSERGAIHTYAVGETNTKVLMSMESEAYYPSLSLGQRSPSLWIASTRFASDLVMPYFSWAEYSIQTPNDPLERLIPKASFVARNCNSKSRREDLVRFLAQRNLVTSLSSCLHNFDPPQMRDKAAMIRPYALHLAFENSIVDDYVTEKLWGALGAGVLPVYLGAPNIRDHIPENSAVIVADYEGDWGALAQHLRNIVTNATLFNSYHAWRYKALPEWFVAKYNFTHTHSRCRLCQKAAAHF